MFNYYRLLDQTYNGFIVRSKDGKDEYFDKDDGRWYETGLMVRYYSEESDQYGMYEEISEKKVLEVIK